MTQTSTDTMLEFKWFGLGALVYTSAYFAYQFSINRKKQSKVTQQYKTPQSSVLSNSVYSTYYFDKNKEFLDIQQSLGDPNQLGLDQIYINSPNIAKEQFCQYTVQIRRRRRLVRKHNQEQYITVVLYYKQEIKELLARSRLQLSQYFTIEPEDFQEMEKRYNGEDLRDLHRQSQDILYGKLIQLRGDKKMREQTLGHIIEDQISFIQNKMFERLYHKLANGYDIKGWEGNIGPQQIYAIIKTLLQDIIYEKYGYETEDIQRKISQLRPNKKYKQILNQRDKYFRLLEHNVISGHLDSVESSENQLLDPALKLPISKHED